MLADRLEKIRRLHPKSICLGLERISHIANHLRITHVCPTIVVGGTNGKGSTVATLEKIYLEMGYQVGTFTSPYLLEINEKIRLNGIHISDEDLVFHLNQVEKARGGILLTEFEYLTLACLLFFKTKQPDVMLLEVGLGGRLDAVNIVERDLSIITNIDYDHMDWLGDTLEKIAFEKAGIIQAEKPLVCGQQNPPVLLEEANKKNAPIYRLHKDFDYKTQNNIWSWSSDEIELSDLPLPSLHLDNVASALKTAELMQDKLPIDKKVVKKALSGLALAGRIQTIQKNPDIILDVAHNPASATLLAKHIKKNKKTHAVFSMLENKDIQATIKPFQDIVDTWYIAPLDSERGTDLQTLKKHLMWLNINCILEFDSIEKAVEKAISEIDINDQLIVFGSFYTVSEAIFFWS